METNMKSLDVQCNELQRKLDVMKQKKLDQNANIEYMQTLYDLRDACRARLEVA